MLFRVFSWLKIFIVATFSPDTSNDLFHLAIQLVNQTNRNLFLTGKAGTGKTTFLKYIRENTPKQMAVVAPTGVAAINAGGVTIHSFFQLPLSPYIPETGGQGFSGDPSAVTNRHGLLSRLRFNDDKRKVLQQLELLVVDEISMVRCDVLDAMDTVLRHIRQRPLERFGGVQVLFIGDMLQLPPVVKDQEWNLLSEYYKSPYFFDSIVLKEDPPLYIEFNKIYRQSDEQFISVLNQVRNNELDEFGMKVLESRFQPGFRRSKQDGYIILTTHNEKAKNTNAGELRNLPGEVFSYEAEITGDFPEKASPADETLYLKEGAQVMFIRNDSAENGKRFFNGKIGIVSKLDTDAIFVRCKGEDSEIKVGKEKWENIRYTLNKTSRQLDTDILGSFTQYPLRLAWAITIHKSQGLTFDKAIIDAGEAFAPGQVYVALSRCTNLEGLVLQSRVRSGNLFSDPRLTEFSDRALSQGHLEQELANARSNYLLTAVCSLFDFSNSVRNGSELLKYLAEHGTSFTKGVMSWAGELSGMLDKIQGMALRFQQQLRSIYQEGFAGENQLPQERIKAAAVYFIAEIDKVRQFIQRSAAVTDSRIHAKEYNDALREIFAGLTQQQFLMEGVEEKFDLETYYARKRSFVVPPFTVNSYAGASTKRTESPHPVLHQQLRKLRDTICSRKDLPIYLVAGTNTLDEMARYLPQTLAELRKISGFGDAKIALYGQEFLDTILEYSGQRDLSSLIHEKPAKRERKKRLEPGPGTAKGQKKADTYDETLRLFREGRSVADIAKERNLTAGTIETHLARFIWQGSIKIDEIMSPEKQQLIVSALTVFDGTSITPVKQQLGDAISFGEIKQVMASLGISQERSSD